MTKNHSKLPYIEGACDVSFRPASLPQKLLCTSVQNDARGSRPAAYLRVPYADCTAVPSGVKDGIAHVNSPRHGSSLICRKSRPQRRRARRGGDKAEPLAVRAMLAGRLANARRPSLVRVDGLSW
jgi:hypothetical protein